MGMKNQQGQGTVEYILLLAVAVSLILTFYRSDTFQKLFGTQGKVGLAVKNQSEFGYRHAYLDPFIPNPTPSTSVTGHPSYFGGGQSRFFGPSDPYPDGP